MPNLVQIQCPFMRLCSPCCVNSLLQPALRNILRPNIDRLCSHALFSLQNEPWRLFRSCIDRTRKPYIRAHRECQGAFWHRVKSPRTAFCYVKRLWLAHHIHVEQNSILSVCLCGARWNVCIQKVFMKIRPCNTTWERQLRFFDFIMCNS